MSCVTLRKRCSSDWFTRNYLLNLELVATLHYFVNGIKLDQGRNLFAISKAKQKLAIQSISLNENRSKIGGRKESDCTEDYFHVLGMPNHCQVSEHVVCLLSGRCLGFLHFGNFNSWACYSKISQSHAINNIWFFKHLVSWYVAFFCEYLTLILFSFILCIAMCCVYVFCCTLKQYKHTVNWDKEMRECCSVPYFANTLNSEKSRHLSCAAFITESNLTRTFNVSTQQGTAWHYTLLWPLAEHLLACGHKRLKWHFPLMDTGSRAHYSTPEWKANK